LVAIVAGQEFQWVLSAHGRQKKPGAVPSFEYFKEDRRVGIYYFYILDPEFGPGFKGSVATHRGPEVELARVSGHDQFGELVPASVARALRGRRRRRGWRPGRPLATIGADGRDRRQLCEAAGGNAQRSQPARDRRSAWVLSLPGRGRHRIGECLAHQASTRRASSAVTSPGASSGSFAFSTI
jgi:hypothetical protein